MTNEEKALKLAAMIPEASVDDLLTFVDISEAIVLNRRYPFGYPEGTAVEPRYEMLQLQIAVEIYNRQGAEGEQSHSENGISRSYENAYVSSSLLKRIVPYAGVPNANA